MRRSERAMGDAGGHDAPVPPFFQLLKKLMPFFWPEDAPNLRLRAVLSLGFILLAKVGTILVPWVYKQVIDGLSPDIGGETLVPIGLILAYGGARLMAQTSTELRERVFAPVVQRAVRHLALRVFNHLHALSLRFHLDRQTGGLSRLIERGTTGVEYLASFTLFNIGPTILELVLVSAILWRAYAPSFTAVTVATIVIYVVFTVLVTRWRVKFRRAMNALDAEANAKAIDSLLNYETVKYFGNERHEAIRFDNARRTFEQAAIKSQTTLSLLNIGQGAIISIGLIALMILAGRGVRAGTMSLGDFVLVNAYLLQLYQPLNILGIVYRNIRQSLTDVEALYRLIDQAPEVADAPDAVLLADGPGAVRFRAVSFAYDPRRPLLRDVSFSVPAGRRVALVGASGAGKSTVARLLFRFYDVTGGGIEIDGQDLRRVTQQSLRAAIGVVPQDTVLFNDTLFYNIAYGCPDASPEAVRAAARLARLDAFIAGLPDGYETRVGERGLKLSGGEKQRVAIARVILKNPRVLIFDEATSALDTETEQAIQESLNQVATDRTTLVIAHRLSTIVDADEILVLDQGAVIERGRHRDLLQAEGAYAALWRRQLRDDKEPDAALLRAAAGV